MSECDKAEIVGYLQQTQEQINAINEFKQLEIDVVRAIDTYFDPGAPSIDKRWMSIAKTHVQLAMMAAVRAIARPNGD